MKSEERERKEKKKQQKKGGERKGGEEKKQGKTGRGAEGEERAQSPGLSPRPADRPRGESRALTYRIYLEEDFKCTKLISEAIFLRLSRLRQIL